MFIKGEKDMTTWKAEIEAAIISDGGNPDEMITTLSEDELNREFDESYGIEKGAPFTAWCGDWVYFPICYDGSEWVGHAPRNPCAIAMSHQGGG